MSRIAFRLCEQGQVATAVIKGLGVEACFESHSWCVCVSLGGVLSLHSVELAKSISISCSTRAKSKSGQKCVEIGNREMSDKLINGLQRKS